MKRILFPYTGDTVGGSHISSLKLAQSLDRSRYEPVVAIHENGLLSDYLAAAGIKSVPAPDIVPPRLRAKWRQLGRIGSCVKTLGPYLKEERIDLVHTHDLRMHLAWGVAAHATGVPHLWHQRTPLPDPRAADYGKHACKIVAVSDYVKSGLAPALQERTEVVFNPFSAPDVSELAQTRAQILSEMGASDADAIVGFVSNFTERKRPEFFVEIAEHIQRMLPEMKLLFPMFGEARDPVFQRVKDKIEQAGMQDSIKVLGTKFPFDPWLASFDILIAPARNEALGRTLIEATLASVAVVATDEGGNREILEHGKTGMLIAPENAEAFAEAACTLLTDAPLKRCLVDAALRNSLHQFHIDQHVHRMTEIYDEIFTDSISA